MNLSVSFVFGNILLGVGLAMDAFSVSMANGLNDPKMKRSGIVRIAGAVGLFQFLMHMLGWVCVHTIVQYFSAFQKAIPWIALGLLGWIGGKMLYEGIKPQEADAEAKSLSHGDLLMQAIATSIDALSVGFTIAEYGATVTKEYVKGRQNLVANPAITEYNKTATAANGTVSTLINIIKTLSDEDAGGGKLQDLISALNE